MKTYIFSEYESRLKEKIVEKQQAGLFARNGDTNLILQEGFLMLPVERKIGDDIPMEGSQYIPIVIVIGEESGLTYQFRLVDLISNEESKL